MLGYAKLFKALESQLRLDRSFRDISRFIPGLSSFFSSATVVHDFKGQPILRASQFLLASGFFLQSICLFSPQQYTVMIMETSE